MSEDLKSSAEEPEAENSESLGAEESEQVVTDDMVDEVSSSLLDEEAVALADSETAEGASEEDEEFELEEEKVKDEIDIQIDLLHDSDWVVRREAVITLGEMADERCVEPLVRALRDGDWQVREAAVEAVAEVGPPAVDMLIQYVRDWESRKYVLRALGKINDERVLDPLISYLKSDEFKDDATRALVELGKPAVPKLIEALSSQDDFVKKQAILALGDIQDPQAVDPLIAVLTDTDWLVRLTAASSLEKIGDLRGRAAIKPLMKDPDMVVRMRVERILAAWKQNQPKGKEHEPANA
ncbi:HEAT repeat domain-containing protein [Candidatus Nitronereus thalassa]|uniref:HEAT repeat domain-containing protein n=1 Tax=Candidatus Nitronereus thalassa TaxID=3020898 RepID=A0ABU3KB60_9BACT|nr:HEAT repeat domain-containing protein [Candidatus Nitronereus thalassa]MDT7043661.1 HEAT repeat domain-containing protein [Candidatus Nitronereus thalassa]